MSLPPFGGIIHVYGAFDSGKTSFALQCGALPQQIVFFDADVKGKEMLKPLIEAGMVYHDLTRLREGKTELAYYDAIFALIQAIDGTKTKVVVFDPFAEFERTFKTHVSKSRSKYRIDWSPMGSVAGAQEWQEAQALEMRLLNSLLDRGIQLVFLTSHMRDDRLETAGGKSVRTGIVLPETQKSVTRMSTLRLWLHRPPSSPVPFALVTKNLQRQVVSNAGIRTRMVLPPKLTCLPGEESLWDAINRYWADPVGFRELLPHERPTTDEISEITNSYGKFDVDVIKALLADAPLAAPDIDPTAELIRQHVLAGNTPAEAATHFGVPLPVALKAIEGKT